MNEIIKKIKSYGLTNIVWSFILSLFFYLVARKIDLQFNLFLFFYMYIMCLCIGHYLIHNVETEKKFEKSFEETFIVIPVVGALTFCFWGLIFWFLDIYFNFSLYFNEFYM
jgi:hypothetical protein